MLIKKRCLVTIEKVIDTITCTNILWLKRAKYENGEILNW